MKRTLYLDCASGISGDMTVGALLDLGASEEKVIEILKSLDIGHFEIKISKVKKNNYYCKDFDVILEEAYDEQDHDMQYLHGNYNQEKKDEKEIIYRNLTEIYTIIDNSIMTKRSKDIAKRIFNILAHAEAKAHNIPVNEVHFHGAGAIDSIVDIISIAVCIDDLDITDVIVTRLYDGQGTIRCRKGMLPIPVPAVKNVVRDYDIELEILRTNGELVTPTGAAVVAALRTNDCLPNDYVVTKVGIGNGKRDYGLSGILKAMLILL